MHATPIHAWLANLSAALDEATTAWDATEEVDTTLGIEVQTLAEQLCALMSDLVLNHDMDPALRSGISRSCHTLERAVHYYDSLDEHDTTAALDIYELLPGALGLAERGLGINRPATPAKDPA